MSSTQGRGRAVMVRSRHLSTYFSVPGRKRVTPDLSPQCAGPRWAAAQTIVRVSQPPWDTPPLQLGLQWGGPRPNAAQARQKVTNRGFWTV